MYRSQLDANTRMMNSVWWNLVIGFFLSWCNQISMYVAERTDLIRIQAHLNKCPMSIRFGFLGEGAEVGRGGGRVSSPQIACLSYLKMGKELTLNSSKRIWTLPMLTTLIPLTARVLPRPDRRWCPGWSRKHETKRHKCGTLQVRGGKFNLWQMYVLIFTMIYKCTLNH